MWAGQWDRVWVEAVTLETGRPVCLPVEHDSWKPRDIYIFNPGFHYKPLLGKILDELF